MLQAIVKVLLILSKVFLNNRFKIKDLSSLRYFLSLEVAHSAKRIRICQRKYALDILADSGTLGCKPMKLPMDQNLKLSKEGGQSLTDPSVYHRLEGRLLYLTLTRPYICFYVQTLSQFMDRPTSHHLAAAYKVLRYIKGAPAQGILFSSSSHLQLQAYYDSNWESCLDIRRSIIEYCVFLGGDCYCVKLQHMT